MPDTEALDPVQATARLASYVREAGTLALSTFQKSLSSLSTPSAFNSETANSSDDTKVTATADADAVEQPEQEPPPGDRRLIARRRTAVEESAGAATGVFGVGYLQELREDWPE